MKYFEHVVPHTTKGFARYEEMNKGFTLVELLIVVTIIALISAIAVPNFLEAQTRAKVARTVSDFRTVAGALEAYMVDHNRYPPKVSFDHPTAVAVDLRPFLTTPIAYVPSVPWDDVFNPRKLWHGSNAPFFYSYWNWQDEWIYRRERGKWLEFRWELRSVGPDLVRERVPIPQGLFKIAYDPSNGTISQGDIFLTGNQLKSWEP